MIAPSRTKGAAIPPTRRLATKVVVVQWPWGTGARSRSPRAQRPCVRAMLVEVQVSSMKTRRPGSRSSWLSNQSSRRFRTSGRSASPRARSLFALTLAEPPQRGDAHDGAGLRQQRAPARCTGSTTGMPVCTGFSKKVPAAKVIFEQTFGVKRNRCKMETIVATGWRQMQNLTVADLLSDV